ncbi:MAG TPA: MFS transporter [Candidatus Dormibacteraeota bacterium]|nr:MFS transporter [Candidatus Dormibacteraeota bacterium]
MALVSVGEGPTEAVDARAPSARPSGAARLLIAAGTSYYGDWLTTVALVVLLFRLTGTATAPALYILARVAPRVLGPGPGGALADRFGAARLAAICGLSQAALTASIIPFANLHLIWAVYLVVGLSQLLGSMAQPAFYAIIPFVTEPERLGRLNAAYSAILETCMLVAPALGAVLLLAGLTPQWLIVGDAGSFMVSAVLLLTLRIPGHGGTWPSKGMFAAVSIVRRDSMLRIFAIGHFCNAAVVTVLQAVLVVAAAQRFGHDTNVGWLYAAVGAGGLLGSLALLRWIPTNVRRSGIVIAVFGELIPLGFFAIAPSFITALLLLFVSAVFAAIYQTRGVVGLQERVPKELLGRANAVIRFAIYVGMLIGAIIAAVALTWLTWDRLLAAVTGAAALVVIFALVSKPSEKPAAVSVPEQQIPQGLGAVPSNPFD